MLSIEIGLRYEFDTTSHRLLFVFEISFQKSVLHWNLQNNRSKCMNSGIQALNNEKAS